VRVMYRLIMFELSYISLWVDSDFSVMSMSNFDLSIMNSDLV
jgi:hypothetical protein